MKKGFTIIEILIAMMILFVAIGFVNISIKAFNTYQRKAEVYQNFYITALSLKDFISTEALDKRIYMGKMNGLNYKIKVKKVISKNNYRYAFEELGGNNGDFLIILNEITLELKDENREKTYTFFLTQQKRVVPLIKLEDI
jgi:prepilin-type N-terminal cleavage/methylation domain-containing protein